MTGCECINSINSIDSANSNSDSVDIEPHTRYVCVDFETNGFPEKKLVAVALVFVSYTSKFNRCGKRGGYSLV